MADKLQLRRGTKARLPALSEGEPGFPTDTRELYIGSSDGNVNVSGAQWYFGTAMSGTSTSASYTYSACPAVKVGDIYLNISTFALYQCVTAGKGEAAKWKYRCKMSTSVTIDAALSTTSANPVRNSVITAKLNELESSGGISSDLADFGSALSEYASLEFRFYENFDFDGTLTYWGDKVVRTSEQFGTKIWIGSDEPENMSEGDIWLQTT